MQGANKEALSRYQQQYQYQVQEAMTRFDAAQKSAYAKYAADMQNYIATMKQTTTGTSTGVSGTATNTYGNPQSVNTMYG
jgi:predicted ribonuclease toxin of YeeF-YezG toxin-antitoxin module